MKIKERLKKWYRGKYVPPRKDPSGSIVIISTGHYEQPPVAKLLGMVGRFYLSHWQWIIGTSIAIIGIIIAL